MEILIRKKEKKLEEHELKYLDVGTVLKIDGCTYAVVSYANNAVKNEYCEADKCLIFFNTMGLATIYFDEFKKGNYEICGKILPESKIVVG